MRWEKVKTRALAGCDCDLLTCTPQTLAYLFTCCTNSTYISWVCRCVFCRTQNGSRCLVIPSSNFCRTPFDSKFHWSKQDRNTSKATTPQGDLVLPHSAYSTSAFPHGIQQLLTSSSSSNHYVYSSSIASSIFPSSSYVVETNQLRPSFYYCT